MKKPSAEQQEWFLFVLLLLIGALFMLIAGQFALQMPRTWLIKDTDMGSKLNPNEKYALMREDYDFRLAPIRTDIPNLLATVPTATLNPDALMPPPAVEFRAPAQIATTTPFRLSSPTLTPSASETATETATLGPPTAEPTETPSPTPWPTNTLRPTATRTPTRTMTRTPTLTTTATLTVTSTGTQTPTNTPLPSATQTATLTPLPGNTATSTPTITPVPSNTATLTATVTHTATATNTATLTPTPTNTVQPPAACVISGSNNYTIPVGGCTATYSTTAQGAIFSFSVVGSGNLLITWYGLPEGQTSGSCASLNSNLNPGTTLSNIAVSKTSPTSTTTTLTIANQNNRTITVQFSVSDWVEGGCQ